MEDIFGQDMAWDPSDYLWDPQRLQAVGKDGDAQAGKEGVVGVSPLLWSREPVQNKQSKLPKGPLVCQVEKCCKDLNLEKGYYQRYRVCEQHLKMLSLMVDGKPCRFCQQCGRFHELSEFDGNKRSCRARLLQHNARRRKRGPGGKSLPEDLDDEIAAKPSPTRKSRAALDALKEESMMDTAQGSGMSDLTGGIEKGPSASSGNWHNGEHSDQTRVKSRPGAADQAAALRSGLEYLSAAGSVPSTDRQGIITSLLQNSKMRLLQPATDQQLRDAAGALGMSMFPPNQQQTGAAQLDIASLSAPAQDLSNPAGLMAGFNFSLPTGQGQQPQLAASFLGGPGSLLGQQSSSWGDRAAILQGMPAGSAAALLLGQGAGLVPGQHNLDLNNPLASNGGFNLTNPLTAGAALNISNPLTAGASINLNNPLTAGAGINLNNPLAVSTGISLSNPLTGAGLNGQTNTLSFTGLNGGGIDLQSLGGATGLTGFDMARMLLAGGGSQAQYRSEDVMVRVSLKIANCTPDQLPPDMYVRLKSLLASANASLVQGFLRPGCSHITLDVMKHCGAASSSSAPGILSTAHAEIQASAAEEGPLGIPPNKFVEALGIDLDCHKAVLVQQDTAVCTLVQRGQTAQGKDGVTPAIQPVPSSSVPELKHVTPAALLDENRACKLLAFGSGLTRPGVKFLARCQGGYAHVTSCRPLSADESASVAKDCEEVVELQLAGLPGPGLLKLEVQQDCILSAWKAVVIEEDPNVVCELERLMQASGSVNNNVEALLLEYGGLLDHPKLHAYQKLSSAPATPSLALLGVGRLLANLCHAGLAAALVRAVDIILSSGITIPQLSRVLSNWLAPGFLNCAGNGAVNGASKGACTCSANCPVHRDAVACLTWHLHAAGSLIHGPHKADTSMLAWAVVNATCLRACA